MQGAPTVAMLIEHDGDLIWPMTRLRSEVLGAEHPALAFAEVPDTVALLAWLHRDLLIKRLDAEIDTESDDASALTHEARQQAEAEVQGDLLDVERQEAALMWQAQAARSALSSIAATSARIALLGVRLRHATARSTCRRHRRSMLTTCDAWTAMTRCASTRLLAKSAGWMRSGETGSILACLPAHITNRAVGTLAARPEPRRGHRPCFDPSRQGRDAADAASRPASTGVNESAHHSAQADHA